MYKIVSTLLCQENTILYKDNHEKTAVSISKKLLKDLFEFTFKRCVVNSNFLRLVAFHKGNSVQLHYLIT